MMSLVNKFRKTVKNVFSLSREQVLWIAPLYLLSLPVWLLTITIPYRKMGKILGQPYRNTQLTALTDDKQRLRAWRIGQLIQALCKYTPWPSKCLVQAMLARFVFMTYGIPHVLYVGICKAPEKDLPMPSHAWLCVDRWVVTGGDGHRAFSIISTFVSPSTVLKPTVAIK